MTDRQPTPCLTLWLALAAGRLLLRRPGDSGLRRLAAPLMPAEQWAAAVGGTAEVVDPPADPSADPPAEENGPGDGPATVSQRLAAAIAAGGETLFQALADDPHGEPLARLASGCRLSEFDLDLLAFAVLPCFDEDAAMAVAALSGGARRLTVGLALKLLFGDAAEPARVRAALRASPLWSTGLLRGDEGGRTLLERRLDPGETLLAGLDGLVPDELGNGVSGGWRVRWLVAPARPAAGIVAAAERLRQIVGGVVHLDGSPERAEAVLAGAAVADGAAGAVVLDAPEHGGEPVAEHAGTPPWAEARLIALATGARVALRCATRELPAPAQIGSDAQHGTVPVIAPANFTLRGPRARLQRLAVGGNDPLELAEVWRARLGCDPADADELAGRNWLSEERIDTLVAALPVAATLPQVLDGIARLTPPRPLRLATRRTPEVAWERLIVAPEPLPGWPIWYGGSAAG